MVLVKVDLVKVDLVKVILVKVDPSDRTTGVDKDPGTGCWGDLLAHQLLAPILVLYKWYTGILVYKWYTGIVQVPDK